MQHHVLKIHRQTFLSCYHEFSLPVQLCPGHSIVHPIQYYLLACFWHLRQNGQFLLVGLPCFRDEFLLLEDIATHFVVSCNL